MKILIRNQTSKDWKVVETAAYGKEAELQHLLAETPGLISVSEVREGAGPLVIAVKEFSLPIGYIDLLAFSAKGDIAIVECKLAANPEAKRKVIGQVLEYGANLWQMSYAAVDQGVSIRTGKTLVDLLEENVDSLEFNEEEFRENVTANLADGNFILVIVVDEINEELSRIVRYMNEGGSHGFDFAALEMRRFHSDQVEMLIPRFYGPAHSPKGKSANRTIVQWDETSFFNDLIRREGEEAVKVARRLLEWSQRNVVTWWGKGTQSGSFIPYFKHKDKEHQLFAAWTNGALEIYFYWYSFKPPFESEEKRLELLEKLNQIEGVSIPIDGIKRRPTIRLSDLAQGDSVEQFLAVYDWVVSEIKKV